MHRYVILHETATWHSVRDMTRTVPPTQPVTRFMDDPINLTQFMDDPINFFGRSYTQMHTIGRPELEELQRQAMGIRFRAHPKSLGLLRKIADRLEIKALAEFNDV